jgi:hypothetical protein
MRRIPRLRRQYLNRYLCKLRYFTPLTDFYGVGAFVCIRQRGGRAGKYAEESIAQIKDRYGPALHCKAGYSYCCCKPGVSTSIPELLRLLVYARSAFCETEIAEMSEHARQYAAQMEGRSDLVEESGTLLVGGRCSVYDVRRLVCRGCAGRKFIVGGAGSGTRFVR